MARVREAQYQELASLRDAKVLRGLMYVHLKKELESTPVDWIECPDRTANVTPGVVTSYGMRRDVQLLLARVRTDLDSFSNCEADALMLSGYLMARSDFAACISGFPVKDCGPQPWLFRQIEGIATDGNASADTASLRNALTVAEHGLGWVVTPGKPDELANAIRRASFSRDENQAERAAEIATHFSFARAMTSYSELVQNLLRKSL